jgi:serine/threonine protein phosphatase PrpC
LPAEQQIITADPDIIEHNVSDEDEFLVLACDGMYRAYLLHDVLLMEPTQAFGIV